MRNEAPALMPIFRSRRQAELLAQLFLHPDRQISLSDLATRLDVSPGALHADVERLTESGLILDRRIGRTRLLRANTDLRAADALTQLLLTTFGPAEIVREEFGPLAGAGVVLIYGSWARRYRGEIGPEAGDIDVMVVGQPDRDEVYDAADRAGARLGLPVNATVRSASSWAGDRDALVVTAKRDAVQIIGEEGIG